MKSLSLFLIPVTLFSQGAPDYAKLASWAAHPQKSDPSDIRHAFLKNEQRDTLADVFFIHPTTFIYNATGPDWNADLDDRRVNDRTDDLPIMHQASVFNGSCRVFAPRYRQAHLRSFFLIQNPNALKSLNLAYEDVRNAFLYYLQHHHNNRPIIIAAHSQGTYHAIRLLKEFFDDKPLRQRLVCAYIPGFQVKRNEFKTIDLLTSPDGIGGYVTWRSYKWGEQPSLVRPEKGNASCINPITWKLSAEKSIKSLHEGAIGRNPNRLYENVLETKVDTSQKILWVKIPENISNAFGLNTNYHNADYNLFWMDIRNNVRLRINTFLKRSKH